MLMGNKSRRLYRYVWSIAGGLFILLVWMESYYVNAGRMIGVLILCLLIFLVISSLYLKRNGGIIRTVTLASSGFAILFEVTWLITDWYPAFVVAQMLVIGIGFYCLIISGKLFERDKNTGSNRWRITRRLLKSVGIVISSLVSFVVIVNFITPAPLMSVVQSYKGYGNSYDAPAPEEKMLEQGHLKISDIEYGKDYPNSYLDVYIVNNDPNIERPTYFFVHGGGWTIGDKKLEDNAYYERLLDAGYNVVSINYALSPGYTYPVPLQQLSQAVEFMQEQGNKYGIDMSAVIFAGSSAGGQIVGQFLNVQTNQAYADKIGITPVISQDAIKAAVLDSAALDLERMGKTKSPVASSNWIFYQFSRNYFQKEHLLNGTDEYAEQGNVIAHVTEHFPPVFIADGNTGTFPDQAKDLATKLNRLGVTNELYLIDKNKVRLSHVFMDTHSTYTTDYTKKKLAFLRQVLNQ